MIEWEVLDDDTAEVRIMLPTPQRAASTGLQMETEVPRGIQLRAWRVARHGKRGRRRLLTASFRRTDRNVPIASIEWEEWAVTWQL